MSVSPSVKVKEHHLLAAEALSSPPFASSLEQVRTGLAYVDLLIRWAVARARVKGLNPDDEFRGLYISEAQIDEWLDYELGQSLWQPKNGEAADLAHWPELLSQARRQWIARNEAGRLAGRELILDRLARSFSLSETELEALLIVLAPEVDLRYKRLFAYLQDDVTKKRPSVDLVLNLLADAFEDKIRLRALFSREGPLVGGRLLVRFADGASREPALLNHFLRPAAPVVELLLGHPILDEALSDCATLFPVADPVETDRTGRFGAEPSLPASLVRQLLTADTEAGELPPIFVFRGGYGVGKLAAARLVARRRSQPLIRLDLAALARSEVGLAEGLRLALRDGRLLDAALYLTNWDAVLEDGEPPQTIMSELLHYPGVVILAGEAGWQPTRRARSRLILRVSLAVADYEGRLGAWRHLLNGDSLAADTTLLEQLANQFQFTPGQIEDVVATARDLAHWRGEPLAAGDLFMASRAHSNQKLVTLATKIIPRYRWADIVLPPDTLNQLREMVNTVRQRPTVYGRWGFGRKLALGKGLNALFAGESGTGKTMAADIMAGELGLDLYKIDLSMLVSKYIGETEKNLNRIFTEAATSNAILFFDEADAIFGKRSEVKDSHDRYANIEISYLLQRMEAYDGVVILATNMRANLDEAFTRRLHFIIEFPFPETADREIIWRVNFPPETPLDAGVDFPLLARRFRLAGGNIRNIIMAAAFLAAEAGESVGMGQLLHAARREYQKIGRLIDEELFVLPEQQV